MQKRFADTMNEMRGLIKEWSVPSFLSPHSRPGILLAVSGGIDSMCMAELFSTIENPIPFAIAHCNFRLRGEESDGDEALVRRWAEDHDVPLHVKSFDTEEYASSQGISIEMAARDLRYGWFAQLCREHGYCAVAVAHNANDNAETLILNLLRGAGVRGLGGMSLVSHVPLTGDECVEDRPLLLRPMLDFTRKQIEGYVFAHKISYRDDSTNSSSEYKRNRIRNEVFPIFETVNPSFIRTFNREMGYFNEAGDILEDWCDAIIPTIVSDDRISIPALLSQKHWPYLLYHILEPYGFNPAVTASVEDLLSSSRTVSGKCFESELYMLYTERDSMLLVQRSEQTEADGASSLRIEMPGIYDFNGSELSVELIDRSSDMQLKQPAGVLIMDAGRLAFPFVLRPWNRGDWFVPFGMKGKKKVSDLFADLKYGTLDKSAALIIEDILTEGMSGSGHIAAVAGVRIDERYRVSDSTRSVIRLTLRRKA